MKLTPNNRNIIFEYYDDSIRYIRLNLINKHFNEYFNDNINTKIYNNKLINCIKFNNEFNVLNQTHKNNLTNFNIDIKINNLTIFYEKYKNNKKYRNITAFISLISTILCFNNNFDTHFCIIGGISFLFTQYFNIYSLHNKQIFDNLIYRVYPNTIYSR